MISTLNLKKLYKWHGLYPIKGGFNMVKDNSTLAGLMYVLTLLNILGIIVDVILWISKKEDPLINYHLKQLIVLWIGGIIVSVLLMIPLIGWLIGGILGIILIVCWVVGMINAFKGLKKPMPLIGGYAESFNF